jgi:NADPH:quinone reductase-like Zn-dependent oxidoreductase
VIRAIARGFGPAPEVVRVERYEARRPEAGEVRVRMTARSINPSDLVTISGAYASRTELPFVPGFEGVGVVESAGPSVTGLAAGDRVFPIGSAGAWQDLKVTQARWCFAVPAALTDEEAATAYVNPLTAWLMLRERASVGAGTRLAVNAAASAIGRILIRMANSLGLEPVALVRGGGERLAGLRLAAVIEEGDPAAAELIRDATGGRGPDLALDAVGGEAGRRLALSLAPGGHMIHYGLLSGTPLPQDLRARRPDVRLELFWLRNWIHEARPERIQAALDRMAALVREGIAATPIARRYPLEEVAAALRHDAERGREGKILLVSPP